MEEHDGKFKVEILRIEPEVKPILSVTPSNEGYTWTEVELMKKYLQDWWACSNCDDDPMNYIKTRMHVSVGGLL